MTQGTRYSPILYFFVGILILRPILFAGGAPDKVAEQPAFKDFLERVKQYEKVKKDAPHLKPSKEHKEITDRRLALAQDIRAARPDAKQGDIFTPSISAQFVMVIHETLQGAGPTASNARKTIRQGEPLKDVSLAVNASYPEAMAVTTVPPTLLLRLPELPDRLEYRIVGHDFVLQDTEARLIVDFIPGAIP
jgi:hypothetical protein